MFSSLTACVCFVSPLSDFLILPGFIDFTSDEVVSIITLSSISQATYCTLFPVHSINGLSADKHEQQTFD